MILFRVVYNPTAEEMELNFQETNPHEVTKGPQTFKSLNEWGNCYNYRDIVVPKLINRVLVTRQNNVGYL